MVRTGRVELPWPFGRQILSLSDGWRAVASIGESTTYPLWNTERVLGISDTFASDLLRIDLSGCAMLVAAGPVSVRLLASGWGLLSLLDLKKRIPRSV